MNDHMVASLLDIADTIRNLYPLEANALKNVARDLTAATPLPRLAVAS